MQASVLCLIALQGGLLRRNDDTLGNLITRARGRYDIHVQPCRAHDIGLTFHINLAKLICNTSVTSMRPESAAYSCKLLWFQT